MDNQQPLYVGIDGGGTKCSAHLFNARKEIIGCGISGPANAAKDLTQAKSSMISAVKLALEDAKHSVDSMPLLHVGAGLAGATLSNVKAELLLWQHPFASFKVDSDLVTASYGAHGCDDGAILIVGTGSSAARFQSGKLTQFGGHGFLLGDKGSGAWLGRSAISVTLEALDNIHSPSKFHSTILSHLSVTSASELVQKMMNATPSQFASLAPRILHLAEQQDSLALTLVKEATKYLEQLCKSALQDTDLPLVLIGGLTDFFKPRFSSALQKRIVFAKATPEKGALYLLDYPKLQE